jgi:glucan phosphoethanolaminetransferase (alkaline phosphatase superfamily)
MRTKIKITEILSWDFYIPLLISIAIFFLLPSTIKCTLANDYLLMGITILSIVLSCFFTSFAVVISTPENDFIEFMETTGDYSAIKFGFTYTIILLTIGLLYSIVAYCLTSYAVEYHENWVESKWIVVIMLFLLLYGLSATYNSFIDSILYSAFRAKFEKAKKKRSTE